MPREVVIETIEEPQAPTVVKRPTKSARVKGSWTMFYGHGEWTFEDGRRYDLPLDLFEYLKAHGNIYDTL